MTSNEIREFQLCRYPLKTDGFFFCHGCLFDMGNRHVLKRMVLVHTYWWRWHWHWHRNLDMKLQRRRTRTTISWLTFQVHSRTVRNILLEACFTSYSYAGYDWMRRQGCFDSSKNDKIQTGEMRSMILTCCLLRSQVQP